MVTVWPRATVAIPMSSLQSLTMYSRAPSGQILDRCVKQQRGLRDAQLLPPLAFLQGVVVQHGGDGSAFDGVLLTELVEIEKRAPTVSLDHRLEAEGHQTGSAAPI
jgi:hypothetical protein